MKTAQDKVYLKLQNLEKTFPNGVTATNIAQELNITRQVVSHYLSRLLEKNLVTKTQTRPVYWNSSKNLTKRNVKGKDIKCKDVFSSFIGFQGSQEKEIKRCKAAVNYPPKGLPLIINGPTGVGKSYLASLIHQYAIKRKVISNDAPFITLNCADYANNPELLSTALFGYKEGAFTGANNDKNGLLKEADGGYLFLDEIHRLSYENQEKLFVFMDKNKFRPLGENNNEISANVRLIFATTEKNQSVLLKTFRRRIPMKINLISLDQIPFSEKLQLIYVFYRNEAQQIKKNLHIEPSVLNYLSFSKIEGNIGMLKNLIKLSCATAFNDHQESEELYISNQHLLKIDINNHKHFSFPLAPLKIKHNNYNVNIENINESYYSIKLLSLFWKDIMSLNNTESLDEKKDELSLKFKKIIREIQKEKHERYFHKEELLFYKNTFKNNYLKISTHYGVQINEDIINKMFLLFIYFQKNSQKPQNNFNKINNIISEIYPRSYYVSQKLNKLLTPIIDRTSNYLNILNTFFLQELINENIPLHGLIIAHGTTTASSIASVSNTMCGTFVFEAIDMPISTSIPDIVAQVNTYINRMDTSKGLIVLVDMGSLKQMYNFIKNNLDGELMIINNLTTSMALNIGFKMLNKVPFKKIAEDSNNKYLSKVKYYEGISPGNNIIVSCISGLGISDKIKNIIEKYLDKEKIEIVTIDYLSLKEGIDQEDKTMFSRTKLVITTSDLSPKVDIPTLNVFSDIYHSEGELTLWNGLSSAITKEDFESLKKELINLFTVEGVTSRLNFLNPKVIIAEVEKIITGYKTFYDLSLDSYTTLNLYMHISLMIERLIIGNNHTFPVEETEEYNEKQKEFMIISEDIFKEITNKYNIELDSYESSLLYELFRPMLD